MPNTKEIPLEYIKKYTDEFIKIAESLPERSLLRTAILIRVDNIFDLVKAYKESK